MTDQTTDKTTETTTEKTVPVKTEKQAAPVARRWDPFAELRAVEAEMDRLMNGLWPFSRPALPTLPTLPATRSTEVTAFAPRMDVYRKDGSLVIQVELPGLTPEEVDITVEDGDLIVQGEKKSESEVKEKDYYRMERSSGAFYRRQPLPEGIKPEQITATLEHGLLQVTIPAPEPAKPEAQKIPISTPTPTP